MPSDSPDADFLSDYGADQAGDFLPDRGSEDPVGAPQRVAYIRTSDRGTFRRCRRKFGWNYLHRGNRTSKHAKAPFWFGTGFHFAMEDYHGYKKFPTARDAFLAYCTATQQSGVELPPDIKELTTLGIGMCDYYEQWLSTRDAGQTLVIAGVPQVEVRFQIEIPMDPALLAHYGYDRCVYTGTIDRVILDEYDRIWPTDYKTAKTIQTAHLDTDPQVTAYCWAASQIYDYPVAGFNYQQHKKAVPHEPEFVKSLKQFSVAKNQNTTHSLYRAALVNLYGKVENAPKVNIQYLNTLVEQETLRADKIIRRDFIERNTDQILNEGWKIMAEATEILNPDLPLYPNPTRDCSWDCDYRAACINLDDGGDWAYELELNTIDRSDEDLSWRKHLVVPEEPEWYTAPVRRTRRIR